MKVEITEVGKNFKYKNGKHFIVNIEVNYNSRAFRYYTSPHSSYPTIRDVMFALVIDCKTASMPYLQYLHDFDYCPEDGEARAIYDNCKKNYDKMYFLFGHDLSFIYDEYGEQK